MKSVMLMKEGRFVRRAPEYSLSLQVQGLNGTIPCYWVFSLFSVLSYSVSLSALRCIWVNDKHTSEWEYKTVMIYMYDVHWVLNVHCVLSIHIYRGIKLLETIHTLMAVRPHGSIVLNLAHGITFQLLPQCHSSLRFFHL